jgi:5,10-methylenetetrahydromethanopterin reductase
VVGLGTGGTMVFAPMGIAPDRPYSSLLEAVDVLTGLLGGERVTHDGEFTVAGAQVPWSPARLPIAIAGRGPRVEQLAIDRADWILCAGRPATTMPELADRVRDPRRSGPPAKIAWGAMTAWTDAGVERLRPYFTFITSNTPRPELHRMGISDAVIDRITDTLHNEGIEAATPLVPDLVLEHYALLGDRASVAARLSAAREQFSPELVLIEAVEQTPEYIRSIAEVADLAGFAPRSALNDSVRQLAG